MKSEMRNHNDSALLSPEYCANQLKSLQTQQQYTSIRHVLKSNKGNRDWMKEFLAHGGFQNLLKNITLVCLPENRPNNSALSALVACVSVLMATRPGLDAATASSTTLNSLILGLISDDELVKRDILTLLATLTLHSATTYKYVLESFNHFKKVEHVTYRFGVLVSDLNKTDSVEYQKSLLNFINCLIDRSTIPDKRIDIRNEIIALGLLEVLKDLRSTQNSSVAQQIVHFYEQKAKDELKLSPTLDVNNPPAMFTLLWRKIAKTPRSNDLMRIVQKLLFTVDTSDLWGAAIDALSGPRSTQGAFKDSKCVEDVVDDRDRFPDPPESPLGASPPQRLEWRAVDCNQLEHSVWGRVNLRQNHVNLRNIGNYFYQAHPDKPKLLFISEEKAVSLNLLLASLNNNNRKTAVDTLTSAIIDGDTSVVNEPILRRLSNILPRDPSLMLTMSEYTGDLESVDSSELLLVSISRIPEFQTRLKCMLGELDVPKLLDGLESCEGHYSDVINSLLDADCPLLDLLKLVLDIGNSLNGDELACGFKLGVLNQLKMMRAPRQPSLTLLHFVTQSLASTNPATLDYISELAEQLEECQKKTVGQLEEELRETDLRLREIRALLVIASKDVKLRYTASVVEAGKRVTSLKNRRKTLDNRISDLAEFFCEARADFCVSSYLANLLMFASDVVECKEVYRLSSLCSTDNKTNYTTELRRPSNDPVTSCSAEEPYTNPTPREPLFAPRSNVSSVTSSYSRRDTGDSDSGYQGRRETYESELSYPSRCESDSVFQSRHNTYESEMSTKSEPVGISLESRLASPTGPVPPPKPQRPSGIYDSNREVSWTPETARHQGGKEQRHISPPKGADPLGRSGDLKRMHSNYRSIDLTLTRSRSQDYYDRYHSVEYRSRNARSQDGTDRYKDRYRHSPPTREQDDVSYDSEGSSSEGSDTEHGSVDQKESSDVGSPEQKRGGESTLKEETLTRSVDRATRSEETSSYKDQRFQRHHEPRTVGHSASTSMIPPVSYLNNTFGGSCRGLQNRNQRTDVRDIFANNDRLAAVERYGSSNSINQSHRSQKGRSGGSKRHPQQHSLQAMLRGDQNSSAVKREPPPIPSREGVLGGGMGKKENSRSTPALYSPYSRSPRSFSPPFSPPPPSGSMSPPHSGTMSPPHSGAMSPPQPGTLSPPARYSKGHRPYSAGSKQLPSQIEEDPTLEVYHERQSSEPTDTRRLGGLVRPLLSVSSGEINKSGVETEV